MAQPGISPKRFHWRGLTLGVAVMIGLLILTVPAAESRLDDLMKRAADAFREGDAELALSLAGRAIEEEPHHAGTWYLRAKLNLDQRRFEESLPDLDRAIELAPMAVALWQDRGVAHFSTGKVREALRDFDRVVVLAPERAPHHWQRGIACYYTGAYAEGRRQFESHQKVNPNDVENAVWHFLCVARQEGVAAAREKLMPVEGDRRVPMREIHRLFAGAGPVQDVLDAAGAGAPAPAEQKSRWFYAHLYLGLYQEALGDEHAARNYMEKAAEAFGQPHFMGDVARVHLRLRGWAGKPPGSSQPSQPGLSGGD